jgi:hopanoid biosynthesis associated protein HpnK
MVGAPAAADAVARAKRMPGLRVGLHLTLVESVPVLAARELPDLVGANGLLRTDMAALSLALLLKPGVRCQLEAEIEAQFEAYGRTGLPLHHVDAHKHFHINPLVCGPVLQAAVRHGARWLRVPREPAEVLRRVEPGTRSSHVAERILAARLARQARSARLDIADQVFGLAWSGAMSAERLHGLLCGLPEGPSEIFTHPAAADRFPGSAPGYRYREELAALTDPAVVEAGRALGLVPASARRAP